VLALTLTHHYTRTTHLPHTPATHTCHTQLPMLLLSPLPPVLRGAVAHVCTSAMVLCVSVTLYLWCAAHPALGPPALLVGCGACVLLWEWSERSRRVRLRRGRRAKTALRKERYKVTVVISVVWVSPCTLHPTVDSFVPISIAHMLLACPTDAPIVTHIHTTLIPYTYHTHPPHNTPYTRTQGTDDDTGTTALSGVLTKLERAGDVPVSSFLARTGFPQGDAHRPLSASVYAKDRAKKSKVRPPVLHCREPPVIRPVLTLNSSLIHPSIH